LMRFKLKSIFFEKFAFRVRKGIYILINICI